MPAWAGRLDPSTIKAMAVYVHSLGGGQVTAASQAQSRDLGRLI